MLRDRIEVTIPTPCHENWQTMTPTEKGRFCASCQKNVHDFTLRSDREIINTLKNEPNACGRFTITQLNRELLIVKEKNPIWLATASFVISLIGLASTTASAQKKGEVQVVQTDRSMVGKFIQVPIARKSISGIISDNSGPLPGVSITIKGSNNQTQTDLDGKFTINAKVGDTLSFQFIGMKQEQIVITEKSNCNLNINMSEEFDGYLRGAFVVGGITSKRRTFLGRVFHSIGKWFK